MTAEPDNGSIEKSFGHCNINWKIENYFAATLKKNWIINSPEFYVTGTTTKWKMVLKPELMWNIFHVILHLQRIDSDPGPDKVWANWRLTLVYKQGEEYCTENFKYYFVKASYYRVDLGNTESILKHFRTLDDDTLNIQCQLIVKHEGASTKFDISSDTGVVSLSQDLKALYKSSMYHDLLIKTERKVIPAHKVVLYTRNSNFASLIDKAEDKDSINLKQDTDAVENVIAYLYSGDLKFVLSSPSISLYECILYLNIKEVLIYYSVEILLLHTTVNVHDHVFLWSIADFSNRTEDRMTSPVLDDGISETCWRLELQLKCVNRGTILSIYAEIVEGKKAMDVCIEFAIMKNNEEYVRFGKILTSMKENEVIKRTYFVQSKLPFLLVDNTLHVVFKFRMIKGEKDPTIEGRTLSFVNKKFEQYHSLSLDMAWMYKYAKFYDIVLLTEGCPFTAHKCILAARSRVFATNIDKMSEGETSINITFPPNILKILLLYIYSGLLKDSNVNNLLHVYEAAEMYAISSLRDACSRLLQSKVDLESVCSILSLAENKMDNSLKHSALKFICLNGPEVFKQECWTNIITNKPLLLTDVINFANSTGKKWSVKVVK